MSLGSLRDKLRHGWHQLHGYYASKGSRFYRFFPTARQFLRQRLDFVLGHFCHKIEHYSLDNRDMVFFVPFLLKILQYWVGDFTAFFAVRCIPKRSSGPLFRACGLCLLL